MSLDIFVTEHFNSTDICEITHFVIKAFAIVIYITRERGKYILQGGRKFCALTLIRRNSTVLWTVSKMRVLDRMPLKTKTVRKII